MKKMMSLVLGVTFFVGMSTTALTAAEMKEDVNKSGLEKTKSASSKKMEMKSTEKYDANKKNISFSFSLFSLLFDIIKKFL